MIFFQNPNPGIAKIGLTPSPPPHPIPDTLCQIPFLAGFWKIFLRQPFPYVITQILHFGDNKWGLDFKFAIILAGLKHILYLKGVTCKVHNSLQKTITIYIFFKMIRFLGRTWGSSLFETDWWFIVFLVSAKIWSHPTWLTVHWNFGILDLQV